MAANSTEEPTLDLVQNDKNVKEAGNPLEQIERLLTCPICLDRYKQPKLLACQHTFCLLCLENYVESTGGRPRLRCPECRAEHGLSLDGGVQSLQTNLTLLSFLEIHIEASAANAAEMQAYVQRFNLERCRICEEKAELELCAHCEKKCCIECRRAHVDMLKRDLGRLLGQVRRLSARVKEASDGMNRGMEQVHANGEQTKAEIRDYFNRYQRELKKREENFLEQADVFVQTEERLMRTLRDALDVEWNNLQDACLWVDAALSGERQARDEDLARFKLEFQQGLDYLRSFQPDSEELFAKKLRFSPGDDAAKLPTAIANFGELTVSLPQFANRYLPLEQQYLPRPFRMSLESENYMRREKKASDRFGGRHRGEEEAGSGESAGAQRWRRRRELEEEAWARLRSDGGLRVLDAPWSSSTVASSRATSGAVSPMTTLEANRSPSAKSPVSMQIPPPQMEKAQQSTGIGANKTPIEKEETEKVEQGIKKDVDEAKKVKENEEVKKKEEGAKKEEEEAKKEEENKCQQKITQKQTNIQPPIATTKAQTTTTAIPATKISSILAPSSAAQNASKQQSNVPAGQANAAAGQTSTSMTGRGGPQMVLPPPQAMGKLPTQIATATGIPTSTQQQIGGTKNAQAEGPPATRGRLLIVNGPRGAAGTAAATGGAPRRQGTTTHSHNQNQNLHHQNPPHPHQQSTTTTKNATVNPKSSHQKPPLPARQLSANGDGGKKRSGNGRNVQNVPQKMNGKVAKKPKDEEEEEEEDKSGRRENGEEERQGRQQQIQSQSTRFRIKYRSSSHGRPKPRPSIEIGQPIPVVWEWPDPPATPTILCRSCTNPDLAVAQSPMLAWRRPSQQQEEEQNMMALANDFEKIRPRPRLVIGDRGSALGQLNWPRGVCPLPNEQDEGDIFAVADSSNHRVQIFSAHEGSLFRSIGSFGTADGQFDGCCVVCVHKNRAELLVADRYNHRVQIFDLRGRFIRKFGSRGTGPGQFQHCWGIAVDEELGLVYVADKDNHRVQMFDAEGEFLIKFGTMGDGARQFNHPLYLAFHSATRLLYVSDSANNRICVYSPDGCPVRQFQGRGPPEEQLKLPRGIALDEKGFLLVADSGNNRIQVFSPQGEWIRQFGSWGAAPGHFKGVEGICLLGGQLAIADRENNRIQLFSCSPNNPPK